MSKSEGLPGPRQWQDYNHIKQEVVRILSIHPEGLTGAKIADEVGITQGAMSKYLSMLNVDGIISSRKVGVAKLWKVVASSDRTVMLADKLSSNEKVNFKDYAFSLVEKDGTLFDPNDKRILLMNTTILLNLYKYTKSIIGQGVHAFFYEWGKDYANEIRGFVYDLAQKSNTTFIQSFISLLKLMGWGRFDFNLVSERSIEVVWHDSIWYGAGSGEDKPVDDFISGALGEAAALSYGGAWKFIEVECKLLNNTRCRFTGNRID